MKSGLEDCQKNWKFIETKLPETIRVEISEENRKRDGQI